jgi:phenylacetate-CoA ligase
MMTERLDLSVISPCFNEEHNISELVRRVLGTFDRGVLAGELILVDDASEDGTYAAIKAAEEANAGRVVGRRQPTNRGIAEAWKTGTTAARAPVVAVIDADLQYQPEDLLRLYREVRGSGVDVVQGWRSPVGRERGRRYFLSRGFNFLLNTAFGMRLQDNKSGFVMCAKEVMEDLLTWNGRYHFWQSFIMVAAHAKGYSYKQIETLFVNRRQGTSFLDTSAYKTSALSLLDLGSAIWEYRLGMRSPDPMGQFLRRNPVVDRGPARRAERDLYWKAYLATFDQTHWMITRNVERYYESLTRTQWLTLEQMRELQNEKLRRLIRHAFRNVPYYRVRMQQAGIQPEDINGQADLHKLPFLTKDDVRQNLYFDILDENHDKAQMLRIATSGSTGEPFVCYADRTQLEFRWAATLRSQEWTGYRFGDRCMRLWHQTMGLTRSQVIREKLDARLQRRKFIPVFEMDEASLQRSVQEIADWNPVLIDGYAEALDFLARYLKEHGRVLARPRAIMSSAQTLPESSRRLIEEAFGCQVFDKYGAREFSGIAYECEEHSGHHLVSEGYIVEILKDGRPAPPGQIGEVIITDLNNYCLPFIRYKIGDLAVAVDPAQRCACGRGLPLIGEIEGRVQSIIQGTDGSYLPGTFFAHYLKEYDHAIRCFQVVQNKPGALTFRVVKAGRFSKGVLERILQTFRDYLGDDLQIDVEFVQSVELIRTGKRMVVISTLPVEFQRAALRYGADS